MGNHGSRKDQGKWGKQGGKAANTLSRVEELRGPPVDAYDKLIAWLAEMAESDNVELDTSVFVSQLNQVCRGRPQNHILEVSDNAAFGHGGPLRGGHSSSENAGTRAPNTRQNSTSCDSHASSDATQRNRSSVRSEDLLDPNSAWRSGGSTRQNTFSDDLEEEEDSDLRNASVESLYSSTDRDSELGSILAYDAISRKSGRNWNFQSSSPLLKPSLTKRHHCLNNDHLLTTCSASTGNLDHNNITDGTEMRCLPNHTAKKSASLLNLYKPETVAPPRTSIPKLVLTREIDHGCDQRPPQENTFIRKKLGTGPKSLSLSSGKQRQSKFERQFSLHSDPRPLTSTSFGGVLPPIFSKRPITLESPVKPLDESAAIFLNDDLLDRNIADILFSVEALWPRK